MTVKRREKDLLGREEEGRQDDGPRSIKIREVVRDNVVYADADADLGN